jgi:hypothetical protein
MPTIEGCQSVCPIEIKNFPRIGGQTIFDGLDLVMTARNPRSSEPAGQANRWHMI